MSKQRPSPFRTILSWKDIEDDCAKVARKIKDSDFDYDLILAVARGGVIPAIIISDILGVKEIGFIQTLLYDKAQAGSKVSILDYTQRKLDGKKVLVIDDISDSGITFSELDSWLFSKGVSESRMACLHIKKETSFLPSFYSRELTGWITYPWTKNEDSNVFTD
jgi:uncharacterized protein